MVPTRAATKGSQRLFATCLAHVARAAPKSSQRRRNLFGSSSPPVGLAEECCRTGRPFTGLKQALMPFRTRVLRQLERGRRGTSLVSNKPFLGLAPAGAVPRLQQYFTGLRQAPKRLAPAREVLLQPCLLFRSVLQ